MRRQARRHFQLDRLQRLIGGRRGEVVEHAFHPGQQLPAFLQRQHHIVEAGRTRIFRDGGDLGRMFGQGAVIGGRKMLRLDPVQRRRAEGRGPVFEKGIGHDANIRRLSGFPRPSMTSAVTLCSPAATGTAGGGHRGHPVHGPGRLGAAFADGQDRAQADAGRLGIGFGPGAGIGDGLGAGLFQQRRGFADGEADAVHLVGAGGHQRVQRAAQLGDILQPHRDVIADLIAGQAARVVVVAIGILRRDEEIRGLDILFRHAQFFQRREHRLHAAAVGGQRLGGGGRLVVTPAVTWAMSGAAAHLAMAGHGDGAGIGGPGREGDGGPAPGPEKIAIS